MAKTFDPMNCGIYKITSPSGNFYIGSARAIDKRWREHRNDLRKGKHHSKPLQRAFEKYGEEGFAFSKVIVCDRKDLLVYEQRFIDTLAPKYNASKIAGAGDWTGKRHTEATKEKMRAWHLTDASAARYTESVRAGMSKSAKIRANSEEGRARLREINLGRKHSAEAKLKMSVSRRGEGHTGAVLKESDVVEIRRISSETKGRDRYGMQVRLAEKFGVTKFNIAAILSGRSWKHLN